MKTERQKKTAAKKAVLTFLRRLIFLSGDITVREHVRLLAKLLKFICYELYLGSDDNLDSSLAWTYHACNTC